MSRIKIVQLFSRQGWARMAVVPLSGLAAWLLLWGGAGALAATKAGLQVSATTYDFGHIARLGGVVQTTFMLRAEGALPLTLRRIWTS